MQIMLDNKITFGVKRQTLEGTIAKALSGMLFFWLPILPFIFIMKRILDAQNGKSKKPMQNMGPPDTTFADVAGVDVVKAELQVRLLADRLLASCWQAVGAFWLCHLHTSCADVAGVDVSSPVLS